MPKSTVSRQVADLERDLNLTLLERSARGLRLSDVGREILDQARAGVEVEKAVQDIVDAHHSSVTGVLRISAPPSISDALLAPIVNAYQKAFPEVRAQIFIAERLVDMLVEGVDVSFIVGPLSKTGLDPKTILRYRHRVVASPAFLRDHADLRHPNELQSLPLYAFSFWRTESTWSFAHGDHGKVVVRFKPRLSINDYFGIVPALLDGRGIGELPPLVRPDLVREGKLVEVLPAWRLPTFDLKVVRLKGRYMSRLVRTFIDFASDAAPELFPDLPV